MIFYKTSIGYPYGLSYNSTRIASKDDMRWTPSLLDHIMYSFRFMLLIPKPSLDKNMQRDLHTTLDLNLDTNPKFVSLPLLQTIRQDSLEFSTSTSLITSKY